MSSQPPDHPAWRLPTDTASAPLFNNTQLASPSFTQHPPPQPAPAPAARKRQFRFSVRADIDLLKLVVKLNPYGAPHGGRLHKWQAIADKLRENSIDIDFRRARDRTGLLLEQWREQDLSSLRRSGSGNHEDQAEKERLLDQISEIELAAKPRDNLSDWRSREQASRIRSQHAAVAAASAASQAVATSDPSTQAALNVIASGDPRASKYSMPAAGQLPPLVQSTDRPSFSQNRGDSDLTFAAQPPEKQLKNNQGQGISSRFNQPLFGNPPSPPKPLPLHSQAPERRSPPRTDLSPYRSELPLLRHQSQQARRNTFLGSSPLDVNAAHAVSSSPRIGEGQNIQLDPLPTSLPKPATESETDQLRAHILRLEQRLEETIGIQKKRLDYDERRLEWEREKEMKRLQLEQERMNKEYEDRKAEREERRRREEMEKEERERMLKIILGRSQDQQLSEGDNNAG